MSEAPATSTSSNERCPKCGFAGRGSAAACARCGLVFANWTPSAAAEQPRLDDRAEILWKAVVGDWNNVDRHDAFLKHCSVAGLLGPAGRRYRERLEASPTDAVARDMQARLLKMATALMGEPAAPPAAPFTRSPYFWMILVGAAVIGTLAALIFKR